MPKPDHSLGFLLRDVARLLRRNFSRRAQELGLSPTQWQALAYLSRQEGVNQATLAESLEVQPISLARLIDRLQEMDLVARRADPDDRRAFKLYLTPKAQPLIERLWSLAAETQGEALAGFSRAQRDHLVELLVQMKQNLLNAEPGQAGAGDDPREARNG
jgi:DNA-binding MarR family transcriptional regulator